MIADGGRIFLLQTDFFFAENKRQKQAQSPGNLLKY